MDEEFLDTGFEEAVPYEEEVVPDEKDEPIYNRHYIITRPDGAIISVWSDGPHPEKDTTNAVCISGQGGYQFRLYPGGEENPPVYTDDGIPLYKWDGEQVLRRTEEELEADRAVIPAPPPSVQERLRADVDFIAAMTGVML